jgi:hypothetical protein
MKTALLLCLLCLNSTARTVYLKAVDEDGEPLDGVTFTLDWYYGMNPWRPKCGRGTFVSGRDGSAKALITRGSMIILVSAQKDGYVYENYLNYSGDPRRHYLDQPGCATKQQPWTAVLRKRMPSSFLLTNNNTVKDIFNAISSSFASNGDGTVYSVNIFGRLGKKAGEKYDDFFVRPVYDAESNRWSATFWTTNAHCGLVATTNRQFHAPASGYTNRVEVPQDMYTSPSFTLYLKTRSPQIYAMLPFSAGELNAKDYPNNRYWSFRCGYNRILINPYGRRELEYDERFDRGAWSNVAHDFMPMVLSSILQEKKRVPIPDLPALIANEQLYAKTSSARGTPRNEKAEIKKKLDAGAYKTPQERENAKQRMHELWLEIDKLQNECVRLKERAATLYLPNDIPDIIPEPPPPDVDGSQQRGNNE